MNGYEKYKEQGVMTASPGDLILMLYDGCIKNLKLAKIALEDKNFEDSNSLIQLAEDIIEELIMSLDLRIELSEQLLELYTFMNRELIEANVKKDIKKIDSVIELMSDLRDTWEKAIQLNRTKMYAIGE